MTMELKPVLPLPTAFLEALAAARAVNPSGADLALANARMALNRIAHKGRATGDYAPQVITQSRGPALNFVGKLLGEYDTRRDGRDRWQAGEVWETVGGAYVAVLMGCSDAAGEADLAEATVVPPGGDETERRIAVAAALNWTIPAREMLRGLGWKLERDVA